VHFRPCRCLITGFGPASIAVVIGALLLGSSGCAAFKATQQPNKKKLSVLTPGTPRSHVIAELGAPVYTEEREGVTTDVFAFKQGYSKGVKAGRALVHGAADVVTGGLWEVVGIPAESLADGTDVKVEVVYDQRRAVQSIEVIEGQDEFVPRGPLGRKLKSAPTDMTDATRKAR
jgi:hypothetical protein